LPKGAWRSKDNDFSLPFQQLVTTSAAAPYYSVSATNNCQRDADLQLLRDAKASQGGFRSLRMAWLGEMFDLRHRFAFKKKDLPTGQERWYLPGTFFPDSCIVAWPLELKRVPLGEDDFFEPILVSQPTLLSIFDLAGDDIQACSFEWKSWVHQYMKYPRARGSWPPAVRLFPTTKPEPLRKVAARNAFWAMSKASVAKFSEHFGVAVEQGSSHLNLILTAVQGVLSCSEDAAIAISHSRIIALHRDTMMSQEIAQLDAAIETFDNFDQEKVVEEKKRAARRVDDRKELAEEYVERKRANDRKELDKKKTKATLRKKTTIPSTIPQPEAKKFLPPNAFIWRALQRGEWAGHLKPYPRCSARWSDHTEQGALRVVLRKLWRQHFELSGLAEADCPIEGLFCEEPAQGPAAASSN